MIARPLQDKPSPRPRRAPVDRDQEPPRRRRWRMVDVSDLVERPTQRSRGRFEGY